MTPYRRTLAGEDVDVGPPTDADLIAASRVAAQKAQRHLAAAIGRLSAAHRDVLLLAAFGELDHEEVAAALGITTSTVRVRLHRARKKVRQALGGIDPSGDNEREITDG